MKLSLTSHMLSQYFRDVLTAMFVYSLVSIFFWGLTIPMDGSYIILLIYFAVSALLRIAFPK